MELRFSNLLGTVVLALAAFATLVFSAGTASATHVSCGDTITQDTTLDGDLICTSDETGLTLGADDITLDLSGHTIQTGGTGVVSEGHNGVVIRNGTVRADIDGIYLLQARAVRIQHVAVSFGATGLYLFEVEDSAFVGNHIARESGTDAGINLNRGDGNEFRANTIIDNAGIQNTYPVNNSGILLYRAVYGDTLVQDNVIVGFANGLLAYSLDQSIIRGNVIDNDGLSGAWIGGDELVVEDNQIATGKPFPAESITDSALWITGGKIIVRRNSIRGGAFGGLVVCCDGATLVADRNTISGAFVGIRTLSPTAGVVRRNRATDNTADGFLIQEEGFAGLALTRNVAADNGDDGFDIRSPVTLSANVATRNGDLGIEAVEGTIDGGGNRAFGNGNPLQCLNVECK